MHILTIIKLLKTIEVDRVETTVDARTFRPSKMKKIIAQAVKTQMEVTCLTTRQVMKLEGSSKININLAWNTNNK
jgi:hypothetical protein